MMILDRLLRGDILRRIAQRVTSVAILLIVLATTALATRPAPPIDLKAEYVMSPASNEAYILLTWQAPPNSPAPDGYIVYMAIPTNNGALDFQMVGRTTETEFRIPNPSSGPHAFYVTSFNSDGESGRSDYAKVVIDNGGPDPGTSIYFTTKPLTEAKVGEAWVYDADAVDPDGGVLHYRIEEAPLGAPFPFAEGMTVNATTGVVEWTPTRTGVFAAAVIASLESDNTKSAMQVLIINVVAPPCATISGTVVNANGTTVDGAYVVAVPVDNNNPGGGNTRNAAEVVNGAYSLSIGEGIYALYLKHPQAGLIWYRNAADISGAERLTVACGDALTADFVVTTPPEPTRFTIGGRVTRKADGSGTMATVQFVASSKNGSPDPATGSNGAFLVARTDADGYYQVELIDGYKYIAQAMPIDADLLSQYYKEVSNPTEATPISSADVNTSIDFALDSRPVYNNGIGGMVVDASGAIVMSQVIAIRITKGNSSNVPDPNGKGEFARTTKTEQDGSFMLENLMPGDYVLLAIPNDREHTPGYFVAGGQASLGWSDATRITIGETDFSTSNTIALAKREGKRGFARLGGTVKVLPGGTKIGRDLLGADPLSGVFVYALDDQGLVGDYTFSDANGWFELTELGVGDYRIIADKVGYYQQTVQTTLDYNGRSSVEQDISMTKEASGVDDDIITGVAGATVYPNPATDRMTVRFNGRSGSASLSIIDPLGRTIGTRSIEAVDGTNDVQVDISALRAGAYRLRIESTDANGSIPFVITR